MNQLNLHKKANMISRIGLSVCGLLILVSAISIYEDISVNKPQVVRIKKLSNQESSNHHYLDPDKPLATYFLIKGIPKYDNLIVELVKTNLNSKQLNVHIVDEHGNKRRSELDYHHDPSNYFEAIGSVLNSKKHSHMFATGYDYQNGSIQLTGLVTIDYMSYYIEPFNSLDDDDQSNYHLISYEDHLKEYLHKFIKNIQNIRSSRYRRDNSDNSPTYKYCSLKLIVDNSFYKKMGENEAKVLLILKYTIEITNQMFQKINFTKSGYPNDPFQDNIIYGLFLCDIFIHTKPDDYLFNWSPNWELPQFIDVFKRLSDINYCLVHLFTDIDIQLKSEKQLDGLSLIGRAFTEMNVGFTSFARYQPYELSGIFNFVHEISHSFEAYHDDDKTDKNCSPNSPNGSYVMSSKTFLLYGPNNFYLSPCSIRDIYFYFKKNAGQFTNKNECGRRNECGNKILNDGEECDDDGPCCNQTACKLKNGAKCSPYNSACCTTDCQIKPKGAIYAPAEFCLAEGRCDGENLLGPINRENIPDGIKCHIGEKKGVCHKGFCRFACPIGHHTCECDSRYYPCRICCQQSKFTDDEVKESINQPRKMFDLKCYPWLDLPNDELVSNGTHQGRCFDGQFFYNDSSTPIFETTTRDYPSDDVPDQDDSNRFYRYAFFVVLFALLVTICYYFICHQRISNHIVTFV